MEKVKEKFNPLVSIVIPVYNGANYMREAIDSALAQTYKNIEIIVVNDGSTDSTEEIAKSYGNKIRYYSKENGGVATALNLAIKNANGDYISWLSHDDIYYIEKIKKQIEKLLQINKDERHKTILYSNYSLINEKSELISERSVQIGHDIKKLNHSLYPIFNGLIHGCTLLIPKKCFDDVGYFDETLKVTQDYDLWFRMFPRYKLTFTCDILIKSRIHDNQGSKTIRSGDQERNTEWIKRIKALSVDQKIEIGDSVPLFYQKTLSHFKAANYKSVEEYLAKVMREYANRSTQDIKVSVVIPFFNKIDWTIEAVRSVLNQTHKNFEIILVNDGSTDSIKKINDVVKGDIRVRLIDNKRSKGAGGARNTGIDNSTGEYLAFLDADDLFIPDKISKQLEFMVRNNLSFTHTSYILFSAEGKEKLMTPGNIDYSFPEIISGCTMATPTVMLHFDLLKNEDNRFPEKYLVGQDVCFWIKMTKFSKCVGISEALSKVRKHDSNVAYTASKQIQGINNINDYVISNFLDKRTFKHICFLNNKLLTKLRQEYSKEKNMLSTPIDSFLYRSAYGDKLMELLRKIVWLISPSFRMLVGNRHRMRILMEKIKKLEQSTEQKINKLQEEVGDLEKKLSKQSK